MKPLTVEISEDMLNAFQEVIDNNLNWTKALIVRALVNFFLSLNEKEQQDFLKEYQVKIIKK